MSAIIELSKTNESGVLSVTLMDLLQVLPEADHKLVWAILDLEAIGDISEVWQAGVLDLEAQTQKAPVIFAWQDLVKLANSFEQVINLTLVAGLSVTDIPNVDFEVDQLSCELAFELVDSTVWVIYAKQEDKLEAFRETQLQSAA